MVYALLPCFLGGHLWLPSSLCWQAFFGLAEHAELQVLMNSYDSIHEAGLAVQVAGFLTHPGPVLGGNGERKGFGINSQACAPVGTACSRCWGRPVQPTGGQLMRRSPQLGVPLGIQVGGMNRRMKSIFGSRCWWCSDCGNEEAEEWGSRWDLAKKEVWFYFFLPLLS